MTREATAPEQHEEVFTRVYDECRWGTDPDGRGSSGPGSHIEYARPYKEFVERFIRANDVKSVVDVGCGDWQFSQFIDWSGIDYVGVDCVQRIICDNSARFARDRIRFVHADLTTTELPYADLYIAKDIFQHVTNATISRFMEQAITRRKARMILITNCANQKYDDEDVEEIGRTRELNANMYPLRRYQPRVVLTFATKQVAVVPID